MDGRPLVMMNFSDLPQSAVRWENQNLDFSHLPHELVRWEKNKIHTLALSHLSKPSRPFPSCPISACSQMTFDGMARLPIMVVHVFNFEDETGAGMGSGGSENGTKSWRRRTLA